MDAIHFDTVVGDDQVIRLPEGICVPPGPARITVVPCAPEPVPSDVRNLSQWLLAMAAEAEQANVDLPSDLATNHDFYAHGKPRE